MRFYSPLSPVTPWWSWHEKLNPVPSHVLTDAINDNQKVSTLQFYVWSKFRLISMLSGQIQICVFFSLIVNHDWSQVVVILKDQKYLESDLLIGGPNFLVNEIQSKYTWPVRFMILSVAPSGLNGQGQLMGILHPGCISYGI